MEAAKQLIFEDVDEQREFFVLSQYAKSGIEALDRDVLPDLLELKYETITDAQQVLGEISRIRRLFIELQKFLYEQIA